MWTQPDNDPYTTVIIFVLFVTFVSEFPEGMILKSADNPGKSSICSKVKGEVLPEKCIRNFVKGSWHFQSASNRFRLVYCERVRSVPGDGGRRTPGGCSGENGQFLAGDGGWHHGGRRRWWVTQCGKRLWLGGSKVRLRLKGQTCSDFPTTQITFRLDPFPPDLW